ncbi:antitoxin Xre/MbcA/ParS toxin-binding domain-containing protein [Legionella sp. CNM-1927-20]|uniref:antitoxin Xre/MbcA/ParS toxin-binding domain-containing protein n=1 Tax=Legionella sp. CNM-1927-20 TaxID=3422221 RepID=UPI00403AAF1F
MLTSDNLMQTLKDPLKEIEIIRHGALPDAFEKILKSKSFVMKDVFNRLNISGSTYKTKKREKKLLDSSSTEKLLRLVSIIQLASKILGPSEAKSWLYREIDSLGGSAPIDLLDTEVGHRLVEQTLQQIKYGIYS